MRTLHRYAEPFIKRFEGKRLRAYQDSAGVWTIGYGTTRWKTGAPVIEGDVISDAIAEEIFREQLQNFAVGVDRLVRVPLTAEQFVALVSLAYNIGLSAFKRSTLLTKLNDRDYAGAAAEFPRWNKSGGQVLPGLVKRRQLERELFESPTGTLAKVDE